MEPRGVVPIEPKTVVHELERMMGRDPHHASRGVLYLDDASHSIVAAGWRDGRPIGPADRPGPVELRRAERLEEHDQTRAVVHEDLETHLPHEGGDPRQDLVVGDGLSPGALDIRVAGSSTSGLEHRIADEGYGFGCVEAQSPVAMASGQLGGREDQ